MTDPWNPPTQQQPYGQPAGVQPQYTGYPPQYGYGPLGDGPAGKVRRTPIVLLLVVVTFGIYTYVYNYKVHNEMKRHTGRGIGGGIALLLTFVAGVAMPFLTPHEVGNLWTRKNRPGPVRAWTGLWVILPAVVGYILFIIAIFAFGGSSSGTTTTSTDGFGSTTSSSSSDLSGPGLAVAVVLLLAFVLTGGIVWLVKTNGALNRYWQTLAAGGLDPAQVQ